MSESNGAVNKAEVLADEARERAERELKDLKREARKNADQVRKEVVHQLHTAADSIRHQAREATENKEVRDGADDVAKGLERAAHYLNKHSVEDMGEDATRSIKRNPWQTVAVALIVGIFVGLFLSANKEK